MKWFRFSLRTLIFSVCLLGSGFGLWWRWDPWVLKYSILSDDVDHLSENAFSKDGRSFVVGGFKAGDDFDKAYLVNSNDGKVIASFGEFRFLENVYFLKDGLRIISIDSTLEETILWTRGKDGIPIKSTTLKGEMYGALNRFYSNSKYLENSSEDNPPCVFDLKSNEKLFELEWPKGRGLGYGFGFSPDGKYIYSFEDEIRLWDARNGKHIRTFRIKNPKPLTRYFATIHDRIDTRLMDEVAIGDFSPSEDKLVIYTANGTVRFLDLQTWNDKEVFYIPLEKIYSVKYSPSGNHILVRMSGALEIWDAHSKTLVGRSEKHYDIATYASDGDRIFSMGARYLDVISTSGRVIYNIPAGEHDFRGMAVSKDGERLAIADDYSNLLILHRRRPEWWWGLAWLWEFWSTTAFGIALFVSLWKDYRGLRVNKAEAIP